MQIGYNTNGFADHSLGQALHVVHEIGYESVAVTLQPEHLLLPGRCRFIETARNCALSVTFETGARFILDPWRKHQPTIISAEASGREQRIEFLKAAVNLAADVDAESVSLWSGAPDDDADEDELFDRLVTSLRDVLETAEPNNVRLSFEPEPGMFIDTMAKYQRLYDTINHELFGLTLDVGHVHCLQDGDVAEHIRRWRDVLWNVHIEDMREGVHEHLMFGEGTMRFEPIFAALREIEYTGPVHVELSRHSHDAVNVARQAFAFLIPYMSF